MNKDKNYWIDENNNKWSRVKYTHEEAIKLSGSMISCINCIDSDSCNFCNSCNFCDSCNSCNSCNSCYSCNSCNSCDSCNFCNFCDSCNSCNSCNFCNSCNSCNSCNFCKNYKQNPHRYIGNYIGSRNKQTITYWLHDNVQVVCGCWKGTLPEFKQRIQDVHGENEYGRQYKKYIGIVEMIIEKELEGGR